MVISRMRGAVVVLTAGGARPVFGLLLIACAACAEVVPSDPLTALEVAAVKAELADRSFRQFEPHVDGDPREGVSWISSAHCPYGPSMPRDVTPGTNGRSSPTTTALNVPAPGKW